MSNSLIDSTSEQIVKNSMAIKAIIQDIYECKDTMDDLMELNKQGREKISTVRTLLDKLENYAKEFADNEQCRILLEDVNNQREELAFTLASFRKANAEAASFIEKSNREELFKQASEETVLRSRQKKDKDNLIHMSKNVTDKLYQISRSLAETENQNADAFELLVSSSHNIGNLQNEVNLTNSAVTQSSKLLKKYDRRELTDKCLFGLVFVFFLSCVFYVLQCRFF